jgi:DNA-binding IclR family transcriptional regulator
MRQTPSANNSIDKALKILSSFAPYNQETGTVEISQKLGFHKATVSRILLNLARHGFLQQNAKTRKFILGPAIIPLTRAVNQSLKTNIIHIAKPFIDELRDLLEETVILEIISGEDTILAYIADGPHGPRMIRLAGDIGDRLPINAAAGAKAILAYSSQEFTDSLMKENMPGYTKNTITDPKTLKRQLEEIKKQGYSYDNEEIDEGTSSYGAPIFNHEKKPVAAVVVTGPSQRITLERRSRIIAPLMETASKISARLYYDSCES